MKIYWKHTTQLVGESQVDNPVSALLVFVACQFSQHSYDMKTTIAQKASCRGYTQQCGSNAYDVNKPACNYRISKAKKQNKGGANSAIIRQLHKPIFLISERSRSSFSGGKNNE